MSGDFGAADATAAELVMTVAPEDDAGAETADRFEWQAAMAAADGLALYMQALDADRRITDDQTRVVCERHEDWVILRGDDAELVSAKHKDPSYGAYTTLRKLFDEGGLTHLFLRWLALAGKPTCRLVTSAGLSRGPAQDLEKVCQQLRELRLSGAALVLSEQHLRTVNEACGTLDRSRLPADWRGDGISGAYPADGHRDQMARFMSVLEIDHGKVQRRYLGFAAHEMFAKPVVERLELQVPPGEIWKAVLDLFRARMRAGGPVPLAALPKVPAHPTTAGMPKAADIERSLAGRMITMREIDDAIHSATQKHGSRPGRPLQRTGVAATAADGTFAGGHAEGPAPGTARTLAAWIIDREEVDRVVAELLGESRQSVAITPPTGLHGAGGFGKTTVADMVRLHPEIIGKYSGGIHKVVLGLDVRSPAQIVAKVVETAELITGRAGTPPLGNDPERAGDYLGSVLDAHPELLLIIDDVWDADQLEPFLIGGVCARRLITTRNRRLLPADTQLVRVGEMSAAQAARVLTFELREEIPYDLVDGLLRATGRWPLLLRLANAAIHRWIETGQTAPQAAAAILDQLRQRGPAALDRHGTVDLNDPKARQTAVRAVIEAGTGRLAAGGFERFTELGVFAADEAVPVDLVIALWGASAAMSEADARDLCCELASLALFELDKHNGGRVRLHDVIRDYARSEKDPARLAELNGLLVDAAAACTPPAEPRPGGGVGPTRAWWSLPDDGYLADQLVTHLVDAGRHGDAETLAMDLRWIEHRLERRSPAAPIADLARIPTTTAEESAAYLGRTAHLLGPTTPAYSRAAVLRSRLAGHEPWRGQAVAWRSDHAVLSNRWPPPDLPDPALRTTFADNDSWVRALAISPDGKWFATGNTNVPRIPVRIRDTATGHIKVMLEDGERNPVKALALSPDGSWLVTAGSGGSVTIWETATGKLMRRLKGHEGWVEAVAVSPDGTWLATASEDKSVRTWASATGTPLLTIDNMERVTSGLAISPDGSQLAAGGLVAGTVRVWDVHREVELFTVQACREWVNAVAYSPDGTRIATAGDDSSVRLWDVATGAPVCTLTGHLLSVEAVVFSPDGRLLFTAGHDLAIRVWDVSRDEPVCICTFQGHTDTVTSVQVSPDGTWIITTSDDGTARIWDLPTDLGTRSPRVQEDLRSVAVSPDGGWIATGGHHTEVQIRDATTGAVVRTLTESASVGAIAVSPVGEMLAVSIYGSDGPELRIVDPSTGAVTQTVRGSFDSLAFSLDGSHLAAAYSSGNLVQIFAVEEGWTLSGGEVRHSYYPGGIAISPDGAWFATVHTMANGEMEIRDAALGLLQHAASAHYYAAHAVAISPDGSRIATGGWDDLAKIWDASTGTLIHTLEGHTDHVNAAAFSPDGAWLATAGQDGTLRVWNVVDGTAVASMRTDGYLVACCFLPDGRAIAATGPLGAYAYAYDFIPP